jgi:hypothetical protein
MLGGGGVGELGLWRIFDLAFVLSLEMSREVGVYLDFHCTRLANAERVWSWLHLIHSSYGQEAVFTQCRYMDYIDVVSRRCF